MHDIDVVLLEVGTPYSYCCVLVARFTCMDQIEPLVWVADAAATVIRFFFLLSPFEALDFQVL